MAGMIVVVSALLPSKQPISRGEPATVHEQAHHDLRVHAAFLGVADLLQLVLLLGLEVQGRDVVEHQGDVPAGRGVAEAPARDPIAVVVRGGPGESAPQGRVAGRGPAQVFQNPAGVQQRDRLHDPGDHQVPEHRIAQAVEPQIRENRGQGLEQDP